MVALIFLYAFGQYEIVFSATGQIPFSAYLNYYSQSVRSWFAGMESVLVSFNVLLFVLYMILLFTGQKAENVRIRRLNEQLHDANEQLRDYALKLERMTELRERNRLAREIHDTLGHTLTGIIMGADAVPSVAEALKSAARYRPDVVLMDIRMPGTDGVEGTKLMLERCPSWTAGWPPTRSLIPPPTMRPVSSRAAFRGSSTPCPRRACPPSCLSTRPFWKSRASRCPTTTGPEIGRAHV